MERLRIEDIQIHSTFGIERDLDPDRVLDFLNILVEASNRQEKAIKILVNRLELGFLFGSEERINNILRGE